jgi:hypothetical protein
VRVKNDVVEKNDESRAECQQVGEAAGMKEKDDDEKNDVGHWIEVLGSLICGACTPLEELAKSATEKAE